MSSPLILAAGFPVDITPPQPGLWAARTARPYLTSAFTAPATDYPLTGPSGPAVRGLFAAAVTR